MTIRGGISYTVESARTEAFDGVLFQIDVNTYKNFFIDSNFKANITSMNKKKFRLNDRVLTLFSDGNYVVRFKKEKNIGYFYNSKGNLQYISFLIENLHYKKHVKYNRYGELDSTIIDVGNGEQFIFDASKKLYAHWIGNNCYNEKGELIDTRN